MAGEKYEHIFLNEWHQTLDYTSPSQGRGTRNINPKDREGHGAYLKRKFEREWQEAEQAHAVYHADRNGVYIEFMGDPGADLVERSLEDMRSGKVRLLNVRNEGEGEEKVTYATVYLAHEKKNDFLNKIEKYLSEETPKGRPKHADLFNSIADLRKALLVESFWSDRRDLIPAEEKQWCEVWLSSDSDQVRQRFDSLLQAKGIQSREGFVRFPERIVKLILADRNDLEGLSKYSDDIAEYRIAKETADFWLEMDAREQAEWGQDLLNRINFEQDPNISVCVLDTGVNNGHPLLNPLLNDNDCYAVIERWGQHDHDKHGTLMSGITAYGSLEQCLASSVTININHCLESVKILPPPTEEENKKELWGYITSQGISRVEINAPHRRRVHCMAVTAPDNIDRGRPSSWSGTLDKLSSGADEEDDIKRLIVVSAGNIHSGYEIVDYPQAQLNSSIQDPAQAWNVLTVGAYTELFEINNTDLGGYATLAGEGELSPFTTTSTTWDRNKWPNKPDIVMEGGNLAVGDQGIVDESDELSLLSTYYQYWLRYFYSFNQTSAATAKAAWFAAKILCAYPDIWPETVRALMVHSAKWTPAQIAQFIRSSNKTEYAELLRICGYGVPDLEQAIYSAANSLTLISEEILQPYDKKNGGGYKTKDMHLYHLPWPQEALRLLPDDVEVEMRITLSYFIEPGPGEIGWQDRYRYPSYGLRFELKAPEEYEEHFIGRINREMRDEENENYTNQDESDRWLIGKNGRNKGSIHSDIWRGNAAQLADSGIIAVYPTIGWWRTRGYLGKWGSQARYSLIVSLSTPSEEVDLYIPVANQVGIGVPTVIET